ncbi:hypothetical protein TNCV_804911 [Trichonephila clavipes]|nr:hypothetical protein TNCV_804911 [Trichonephila clavipes]
MYRVLPNSTNKCIGVKGNSMGMPNEHRTGSRKPRLFGENPDNINRRDDDQPNKASGQTNAGIWSTVLGLKKPAHLPDDLSLIKEKLKQ